MPAPEEEAGPRKSREILARLEIENGLRPGATVFDRLLVHFMASKDETQDKAELWGLRVGRILAAVFIIGFCFALLRIMLG